MSVAQIRFLLNEQSAVFVTELSAQNDYWDESGTEAGREWTKKKERRNVFRTFPPKLRNWCNSKMISSY